MAKTIFGLGIFAAVALVMISIGVIQRRSRTPVGISTDCAQDTSERNETISAGTDKGQTESNKTTGFAGGF